eukprot:5451649-Alexandrium_andersonii.AAC.1
MSEWATVPKPDKLRPPLGSTEICPGTVRVEGAQRPRKEPRKDAYVAPKQRGLTDPRPAILTN